MENLGESYDLERKEKKRNRKATRKLNYKALMFAAVFLIFVFGVLMSPIFNVENIVIKNSLHELTEEEAVLLSGVNEGDNLLFLSKKTIKDNMLKSAYVEDVEVNKVLMNTIDLTITERRVRGYVPYMDSYLYIDEQGRILDINSYFTKPLPVVKGLEFDSFIVGEKISADNKDAFDIMVTISQVLTKYQLNDLVVEIDVSDTANIVARVNKVDIEFGNILDCDEKIRVMAEVIKNIPEEDAGSLDLSDLSKPIVFKYLT